MEGKFSPGHPGQHTNYQSGNAHQAAWFLGAAIAVTAFRILARIIYEPGLPGTLLGTFGPQRSDLRTGHEKVAPFTVILVLPMFFSFSRLNTRLEMMLEPSIMLIAIDVLQASTLRKSVACRVVAQ